MARKKIRECHAMRIFKAAFQRLALKELPIMAAQVDGQTDYAALLRDNPWLGSAKLVVKPDMLMGQRGKHDLIGLNLSWSEAAAFIKQRLGKEVTVKGCTAPITTFVVAPFVPHTLEYYLSITSDRLSYTIGFSDVGGMDIEKHWDQLRSVTLDVAEALTPDRAAPLTAGIPLEAKAQIEAFITSAYQVFLDLDCSMLEMNPFTVDASGQPFPLDMRMELDDTAQFRNTAKWMDVEFPLPFGRTVTPAEAFIAGLDRDSGASLKFTVLNPAGRVWLMVAGGGASVIYTDTVADLGYAQELGNYGEYSGAPSTSETFAYANTVLGCATSSLDGRGRALIVGGGIANFTDVASTFTGIIAALRQHAEAIRAAKMNIFVRRGGPNYVKGLQMMRDLSIELNLPIKVYGPECSMTAVCAEAIDYVRSFDS